MTAVIIMLEREVNYSPPLTAEIMTAWSFTFTPLFVIVAWWSSTEKIFPMALFQHPLSSDSPL
jgi:hypothetical protein